MSTSNVVVLGTRETAESWFWDTTAGRMKVSIEVPRDATHAERDELVGHLRDLAETIDGVLGRLVIGAG